MKWIRMRALGVIRAFNMRVVVLATGIHGAAMGSFVWVDWSLDWHTRIAGERARTFLAGSDVYPTTLRERYEAVLYWAARLCFVL